MKKSTLALGVIVALGAAWTGGAWYTGKTIEAENLQLFEQINQQHAGVVQIKNMQFERGVFSSQYHYDLIIGDDETGLVVPLEGTMYHGPLPLNQVAKFNLAPAALSATVQLTQNDKTADLFALTNGKNPLDLTSTVSYSQQITADGKIAAGKFKTDEVEANWSDVSVSLDTNKGGIGEIKFDTDQLNYLLSGKALQTVGKNEDPDLKSMWIELSKLKFHSDLATTELENIFTGFIKLGADKLNYRYDYSNNNGLSNLEFKDVMFDYQAKKENNWLNYTLNANAVSAVNQKPLGDLKLALQANHLNAQQVNNLVAASKAGRHAEFDHLMAELLKNQPHFVVNPLSFSNEKGKATADLNIELLDYDIEKLTKGKVSDVFKQFNLNVSADKAALTESLSVITQAVAKTTKEVADQGAEHQVESWTKDLKQQGITTEKDGVLSLNLSLAEKNINFNGNTIPEEYIGMLLLGVMMQGVGQ
ncbi:hypothetical protein A4G18_09725 [Pasteurellaceae bacterium Pebbles2]|nr:hypothetical protein [Pasteurellaceae bacterium Pebbles2]